MIKCGAIAAVAIAAGATGTATLVSNTVEPDRVAASDQSAYEQAVTVRGTRSLPWEKQAAVTSLSDQSRRGERPEYDPLQLAMAPEHDNVVRRGIR